MLKIKWGFLLTTSMAFATVFVFLIGAIPMTVDPLIRITYAATFSLSVSMGLAFISLMYLFSRDCKIQLLLTCAMLVFVIVMGYILNPIQHGNYTYAIIVMSAIAAIEIAFLFSDGIQLLENQRAALYTDVSD